MLFPMSVENAMYKHILLPVDGSELSLRAAEAGIALARQLGARVHALHVVVPLPAVPFLNEIVATSDSEYADSAEEAGTRYLAAVRERADAAGVPCQGSLETDARPHRAIAAVAQREGCDLIVMGSHGWRGMDRLLLGSETQRVILESELPVLVHR
jgi:nucleotide-binding universal stress UspA family protein